MEKDTAKGQAIAQVESIVAMVGALGADYDRLEELTGERDSFVSDQDGMSDAEARALWAVENPSEAEELAELTQQANGCDSREEAEQQIQEDALSVEVRSDWGAPGEELTASEFRVLLCTGGPHVEIVGELDQYQQPSRVRVLYKDWGTSGELFPFDHDAVCTYCQQFYFGG